MILFSQKFILVIVLIILCISKANANDMINNTSVGYVSGSITQIAKNNSTNVINIGSIIGENVKNVSVQAHVKGDIFVKTNGGKSVALNIGSYRKK